LLNYQAPSLKRKSDFPLPVVPSGNNATWGYSPGDFTRRSISADVFSLESGSFLLTVVRGQIIFSPPPVIAVAILFLKFYNNIKVFQ